MRGQWARYTEERSQQAFKPKHDIVDELVELREYTQQGSEVAQHMLGTRMLWYQGLVELEFERFDTAVSYFSKSCRISHKDGDPFCGLY